MSIFLPGFWCLFWFVCYALHCSPSHCRPGQFHSSSPLANRHFILAQIFHFLFPQHETRDPQVLGRIIIPLFTAHSFLKSPQISSIWGVISLAHSSLRKEQFLFPAPLKNDLIQVLSRNDVLVWILCIKNLSVSNLLFLLTSACFATQHYTNLIHLDGNLIFCNSRSIPSSVIHLNTLDSLSVRMHCEWHILCFHI